MVKIAIRDDDMNFFTKVKDIEDVYRDFGTFPISFAVIPRVLDVSTRGACSDTKGNTIPQDISKNTALVDYIKNRLANSTCDILLHGINHGYHFEGGTISRNAMAVQSSGPLLRISIRKKQAV